MPIARQRRLLHRLLHTRRRDPPKHSNGIPQETQWRVSRTPIAVSSFGGGGEISFLMEFEDAVETPEKDSDAACET